ncbi:hypothetical protein ANN_04009 [Periplaneta americana]|uniref:HTH CENPB-type domain-containing protein n=1 Tax=Periplaneta americana TaxID=6978 RepID=A0ABQ8T7D9_PERAM|nr:hypothetical protein ANN_04009 [Periplaneta americana]
MSNSNKCKRGDWSVQSMTEAVKYVQEGGSQKKASLLFNVPRQTLRRHLEVFRNGGSIVKSLGRKTVLSDEQEKELVNILLDMEARLYGLTPMRVRYYVYQYCEANSIQHPFNRDKLRAGWDWLKGFLNRHPILAIRHPQGTSIQRAQGFNRAKVELFFENFHNVLYDENGKRLIPPDQIYNCHESGYTVVHKPPRIISQKGKRTVGALTSAEKGKTVSVLVCTNPAGHYIPPLFLFPRVRMKPELLDKAPVGSIGIATKTGWISTEPFAAWFDHFLEKVQPKNKAAPTLLILDGHKSHTRNFKVVLKARRNNVKIICLPSHCTHKLQPLDVAVFRSINHHYDEEIQTWILNNPGRAVTECDIRGIFAAAYSKGASLKNAESGFRKAGIQLFNKNIFGDSGFIGAEVSHRACSDFYRTGDMIDDSEPPSNSGVGMTNNSESESTSDDRVPKSPIHAQITDKPGSSSAPSHVLQSPLSGQIPTLSVNVASPTSSASSPGSLNTSFRDLIPIPKREPKEGQNARKRKVQHSFLVTGTPHKIALEETEKNKQEKEEKKQDRLQKSKKKLDFRTKSSAIGTTGKKQKESNKTKVSKSAINDEDAECLYCSELYSDSREE